ncbi:hypothetical protein OEZ86_001780 [Tetradesmus obliquus]|nr:hypothetical protein OEZ86_001780 [Tetradesmus obliquus]
MLACGSLDDQDAPPRTAAPKKPKQPFLKRGEGVKRRVEAFKHRKPSDVKSGGNSEQSLPDQFEQQQGASVRQAAGHRQRCPEWRNEEDAYREPYGHTEEQDAYTAEQQTRSNGVDRDAQGTAAGLSDAARWGVRQAEEDLELEEFRALEQEILALGDVVGVIDGVQLLAVPADQVAHWQQLEASMPDMQRDKEKLRKMRVELERAATRLEQERSTWEKQKSSAQASLEAWRSEEARRLARERRVLEQQSRALLSLPNKKEKQERDGLQAQIEKERADAKAAAARQKLTVERLRCTIKELQDRNNELREEVRWHEAQQLNSTAFAAEPKAKRKPQCSTVQTQTDAALMQQPSATAAAAAAATAAAAKLEAGATSQQQQQQQALGSSSGNAAADPFSSRQPVLLQELEHADGKLEQLFADGTRVIYFTNGSSKKSRPGGSSCIRFANGDIKHIMPSGRVDYYYASVATWQSSHPSGLEVFYFPSGQVEGHTAAGVKDIVFPDGSIRRVQPDGSEQDITAGMLPAAVRLPPPDMDSML